jgi:hypothetical protein
LTLIYTKIKLDSSSELNEETNHFFLFDANKETNHDNSSKDISLEGTHLARPLVVVAE